MKIVKLDRRYKGYKLHHTIALRFDNWYKDGCTVETLVRRQFKHIDCHGYFSKSKTGNIFWISFKNESDLTMVLLAIGSKI